MIRLVLATLLSTLYLFANAADPDVPATFLPPPNDAVRRALQKPVSGDFHAEPVGQVFGSLAGQLQINLVFSSNKLPLPIFTGKFDSIPFRTAIFLVAREAAFKVEWTTRPDGGRVISIHD